MNHLARVAAVAAFFTGSLAVAGCNGEQPDARSTPSRSASAPSSPAATSDSAVVAPEAWRDKFTEEQLESYDEAVATFTAYETRSAPIWAAGKVTDAATELFKEYFPSPAWQQVRDRLMTYETAQVSMTGLPTVLDSRARKIATVADGGSVTIVQCVDYTTVQTTQYGQPVSRDEAFTKPVQRTVILKRSSGSNWLIYDARRPTVDNYRRCGTSGGAS